jgi:hypothetical protein
MHIKRKIAMNEEKLHMVCEELGIDKKRLDEAFDAEERTSEDKEIILTIALYKIFVEFEKKELTVVLRLLAELTGLKLENPTDLTKYVSAQFKNNIDNFENFIFHCIDTITFFENIKRP